MNDNPQYVRQTMGCGYEPPLPTHEVNSWEHVGRADDRLRDAAGSPLKLCPGYACGLPEVIEVARARSWKSSLHTFTNGEQPSEALVAGIEILDAEANRTQDWAIRNPVKER